MRVVLLLAAGASWETQALQLLSNRRDLVVLKRCVDVEDLIASATAGQADTAVVALEAPGFDIAAVDHLRAHGVRPVAVVPAPTEHSAVRASRIGVRAIVADGDLTTLPGLVTRGDETRPPPAPPPDAAGDASLEAGLGGTVVTVCGPVGAPGRTTVAATLAAALAGGSRTTLVDADPHGGTVAQQLGVLDEVSGLLAAARLAGGGLLEERFASVQRSLHRQLTVVTGLPRRDRWPEVRPGTVELLAETARRQGHVVIDAGPDLVEEDPSGRAGRGQLTRAALQVADAVVVVGTADPVGLSRLARCLADLRDAGLSEEGAGAPTTVVVNRMRPSLGWSERDVTQLLSDFVRPLQPHFLPEDRVAVDRALVTGRSLLETDPGGPLCVAVQGLAAAVVPGAPAPAARSPQWFPWSRAARFRTRTAGRGRRL